MSCSCKFNSAVITPVLASGSAASPYYVQVNINQRLCHKTCSELTPVFNPTFSVQSINNVGTDQYVVNVLVQGVISYVPCSGTPCCTKNQVISQTFSIPIQSDTAPTSVTLSAGSTVNSIAVVGCQSCSRNFISETPLTMTVVVG